jgi:hypothetical protein
MRFTSFRISGTFCGCSGSPESEILALDARIVEVGDDAVGHLRVNGIPELTRQVLLL